MSAGGIVHVLDDDPSFVRSTLRLLAAWDLAAEGFTSWATFLAHGLPEGPACVVLDLRMPGMSGLEVQRALGADGRRVPVVFVSGHADLQPGVEAMKAGAVDFLSKPVDEARLLAAVRRALELDAQAGAERRRARDLRARVQALAPDERQVCDLVVTGLRDDQIAAALGWTEAAVHDARTRAMAALSAGSLVELLRTLEAVAPG